MIRDLFGGEGAGGRLVSARDRHVLASSWSLPFAIILAFTGSFFSFALSVSFPIVAQVAFGGDREAMAHTLFEAPVAEDTRLVCAADLDAVREKAIAEVGRSEEHTSELQSLMRTSYAVLCLKKKCQFTSHLLPHYTISHIKHN